ncbi:MAG TPA: hypothetical protein VIC51_03455 [Psychromonas sp.]
MFSALENQLENAPFIKLKINGQIHLATTLLAWEEASVEVFTY